MATNQYVESFQKLSATVHDAGLVQRRRRFYIIRIAGWLAGLALLVAIMVWLGPTWFQLIIAGLIGVVMAQVGFLSHEAAHRQVCASRAGNVWVSRVLSGAIIGLSYTWWMAKHNAHHAHPNTDGKDPDVSSSVLVFTPEARDRRTGMSAWLARYQSIFFIPLLFLEGMNLHYQSIKTLVSAPKLKHRYTELAFIAIRHTIYLAFLFTLLPWGMALAFFWVQVGVFGLHLGGAFALNHIGMPTVPHGVNIDFLRRQIRMSRNIKDGPFVRFFMGGLQFQIEHHLFPVAPRPSLPQLQQLVQEQCARLDILYTERTLFQACKTVVAYLNQVGVKNRDPYTCPLVQQYRG